MWNGLSRLLFCAWLGCVALRAEESGEKLFALEVSHILAEKCSACHSSDPGKKLKGGLELTSRELMMKGGDSGEVVMPGKAEESLLYIAVTWKNDDYEMPPKEADRLEREGTNTDQGMDQCGGSLARTRRGWRNYEKNMPRVKW